MASAALRRAYGFAEAGLALLEAGGASQGRRCRHGHSVETHLSSYSKWCGDDVVDDPFERAAKRLGR